MFVSMFCMINSKDELTIFITTHKDFESPLFNTSIYKIVADDKNTTKNK